MAVVQFQDKSIEVSDGDTILTAFEKANVRLPSSCRAGLCQACLMVVKEGKVPSEAIKGLDNRQIKQNLFFACQCQPTHDMVIALPDQDFFNEGILLGTQVLNDQILQVQFKTGMKWQAGQYTTVWRSETVGRTFSIASLPYAGVLELHIRRRPDGQISHWLETQVKPGDVVRLSEAKGHCFYDVQSDTKPLVLAGTGTGLAPLYGVVQEALMSDHLGEITLYAAAGEPDQLYLVDELRALDKRHPNFHYQPVVRRNGGQLAGCIEDDLIDVVTGNHKSLGGHYVYLCGAPELVNKLKKLAFLQGASMSHIYVDAFESGKKSGKS